MWLAILVCVCIMIILVPRPGDETNATCVHYRVLVPTLPDLFQHWIPKTGSRLGMRLVCIWEVGISVGGGRDGGRERNWFFSLPCTVESDKEKPQYKSLLDLPYMSRELTEKLDEYSNPTRPKSRTRRATIGSPALGKQLQKRRPSVPTSKRSPMKKINPAPSIAE